MRRHRLTEDEEERLAEQGQKYLDDVRGLGRPLALQTAPAMDDDPPPAPGADWLDASWVRRYGETTQVFFERAATEAEALELVRRDRRLAPLLKLRIEKKLTQLARAVEPRELQTLHQFFVALAAAFRRRRGRLSDWDRARVRPMFEERQRLLMGYQQEFRRTGKLPPVEALPVFEMDDGEFVTTEHDDWPTLATRKFLEAFLDAKPRTLERYMTSAPRRRRPRKPRRR